MDYQSIGYIFLFARLAVFVLIVAAIIVFLVIPIVQIIINYVSGNDDTVVSCFNCFISGKAGDGGCVPKTGDNSGM